MMGCKPRHIAPVTAISLEELVPPDHFYRALDRLVDLSFVRLLVQDTYAAAGRPSIDPVVFFKLQLVMFLEGLRSERLLMRLVADKLSVRWYLGYNLDESLPDHSSLTRIRQRYGVEIFRRFFDAIVEQCRQAGLVWGKECYIDATQVQANADVDSLVPRFAVEAKATLHQHLATLFPSAEEPQAVPAPASAPTPLSVALPAEVVEELAAANAQRHDWYACGGQQQREVRGQRLRTADFRISTTDPDATPVRWKGGGTRLGYQTHYVVDGGKRRIILAALVTPGEVMENQPMLDLVWHTRFRWHLPLRQVTGDTTYGTIENIRALEDAGIRAYVPLPNWDNKSEVWSSSLFRYEAETDQYRCPQGQVLTRRQSVDPAPDRILYQALGSTCKACPVQSQCTTTSHGRRVYRSAYEAYLERVRSYHLTDDYQKARRKRQVWVEPLFGEAKQWHGLRRFRLRRLWKVNCEALLTASGQNIKRLLQQRGWGHRPIPTGSASLPVPRRKRGICGGLGTRKGHILADSRVFSPLSIGSLVILPTVR